MTIPCGADALFEDRRRRSDATRAIPHLGALIGIDLRRRDALAQERSARFRRSLARALVLSRRSLWPRRLDGSPIGFTLEGDTWTVCPDGTMGRSLCEAPQFPGLLARLSAPAGRPSAPADHRDLLEAAFLALWMPSATNWQPVRVVEMRGPARIAIARALALAEETVEHATLAVLLRRPRYESLLGDVMEPFGLQATAHEEWIDSGLFEESFALALSSRGCDLVRACAGSRREEVAGIVLEALRARSGAFAGVADEAVRLRGIAAGLEQGGLIPDGVLAVGAGRLDAARRGPFARVVLSRASERVASPRPLDPARARAVVNDAFAGLDPAAAALVRVEAFEKGSPLPEAIGKSMHEALYGTSEGGGFLGAFEGSRFLAGLEQRGLVPALPARQGLAPAVEVALKERLACTPVPDGALGVFLTERLELDGRFRRKHGVWVDEAGRPVPAGILVRLIRSLASVFGRFFLRFADTHPVTFLVLARTADAQPDRAYHAAGRLAARLVLTARARGLTSVVKTGPLDLAGEEIARLAADALSQRGDGAFGRAIARGDWRPAIVAQIGWPLAGSDPVGEEDHRRAGLEERLRDRRPPRDDVLDHVLPDPGPTA